LVVNWRLLASTATVAAFGFVAPAVAADLPVKAPPLAGVVAYNWSGCYVGGNAGWIGGADSMTEYLYPTRPTTVPQSDVSRNSYSLHGSGVTGGGQVGCNIQMPGSAFVFGLDADISGSSLTESASAIYGTRALGGGTTQNPHTETVSNQLDWYSTVRGRVGVTRDRWLAYVTGGLAVGGVHPTTNYLVTDTNFLFSFSGRQTRVGWTAGGGLEYAFANNWSAKVEYLYLDFGSFSYADNTFGFPTVGTDVRARDHVVRVGLNYKFGGLPQFGRN
jgi:outer membrane immunogenic protein